MLISLLLPAALAEEPGQDDAVLEALRAELDRTMSAWKGEPDAPYFLSYRVQEERRWSAQARYGSMVSSEETAQRTLDVSARVGSPELDSTHALKGDFVALGNFHLGEGLPLDGEALAMQASIWIATSKEIADAQERWLRVKTNQVVKVEDDHPAPDFSVREPKVDVGAKAAMQFDLSSYQPMLVELSALLDQPSEVYRSSVDLNAVSETEYFISSEGTVIRHPREWVRIALQASTTLEDGADVQLYRWRDVADAQQLPKLEELRGWAAELQRDILEMRAAPKGEPYSGPVLLRGRAAGVFVHEVLGHRVEGQRQKDDDEGQTFTDKVGQAILPSFVSVYDDPTLATYAGEALNGHYLYDQEGVPAQKAVLVENGVLKGFLLSRSPIEGFSSSNGHGRAQPWEQPVGRMASTILETSKPTPWSVLRTRMMAELKAQGRPWGLIVDEIAGGFTLTGRVFPNAFNVRAVTAWKIFADGRPDERIRGIDLVGTPLVALSNVMAVGDDPAVFNGFCGAESGFVPNSAISPSLLLKTLEVQKKEKDADRPPLLSKPKPGGDT